MRFGELYTARAQTRFEVVDGAEIAQEHLRHGALFRCDDAKTQPLLFQRLKAIARSRKKSRFLRPDLRVELSIETRAVVWIQVSPQRNLLFQWNAVRADYRLPSRKQFSKALEGEHDTIDDGFGRIEERAVKAKGYSGDIWVPSGQLEKKFLGPGIVYGATRTRPSTTFSRPSA